MQLPVRRDHSTSLRTRKLGFLRLLLTVVIQMVKSLYTAFFLKIRFTDDVITNKKESLFPIFMSRVNRMLAVCLKIRLLRMAH